MLSPWRYNIFLILNLLIKQNSTCMILSRNKDDKTNKLIIYNNLNTKMKIPSLGKYRERQ
jgi:hypothetical protein